MYSFPCRLLAAAICPLISWASDSSKEPAKNLIALVPPGIGMVAGMEARHRDAERPDLFIPLPGKSLRDYDYFGSLCGADPARSVNEVIFVDDHLERDDGYDHTLLARGYFSSEIIYRSAINQGAERQSYRGLPVLSLPPLARERTEFNESTWLAIVDARLLLLGTPEYVRQELDRLLASSEPDPALAEQFAAVQRSDVWWIMFRPFNISMVRGALITLSPVLADLLNHSSLRMATRYGRRVEFDYQVDIMAPTVLDTQRAPASFERSRPGRFALAPDEGSNDRGVIRISRARYRQWVSEVADNRPSYR
jgi:hypothetical protein